MATATNAGRHPAPRSVQKSAMFTAPGRPRPLARRLAIHNRVVRTIRDYFQLKEFHEIPVTAMADHPARVQLDGMIINGFPQVWCESELVPVRGRKEPRHLRGFKLLEAAGRDMSLEGLADLQEELLKTTAMNLGADLLGGRDVTRLDRMLHAPHPRFTYQEALDTLESRGWSIPFGGELHLDAEATLTRFCGNLPFMVTHMPIHPESDNPGHDPEAVAENVAYFLPYAGITMRGRIRKRDPSRGGFSVGLGHLLQYLMGLDSVMDTLIDPMDRIARLMEPSQGDNQSQGKGST